MVVTTVVIQISMLAILVWNSGRIIKESHIEQLERTYAEGLEYLSKTVSIGLLFADRAMLAESLSHMESREDFSYAIIYGRKNQIMASSGDVPENISQVDANIAYMDAIDIGIYHLSSDISKSGQFLGNLQVGFKTDQVKRLTLGSQKQNIVIAAITFFLTLIASILLGRYITLNLRLLEQGAKHFSEGDFDYRIKQINDVVIDDVASAFNTLASNLHTTIGELNKRNRALQESEQDLAITLNSIGDAVITTGADGHVTRMNPVAERLTGWTLQEARGQALKSIFPIIDASTRKPIENPVEVVMATGQIVYLSNHTTLIARDGTEYQIADSAAPIRNGADTILGMVLVFNDVTDQYKLRETAAKSKRDLQAIMDHSPAVIYVKDTNGRFTFVNQKFEKLFHVKREDISGKTDHDIFPKENADEFQQNDKAVLAAGHALKSEEVASHDDGYHTYVSIKFPLFDDADKVYAVCGISTDITERKQQEEQLRRSQKMEAIGQLSGGIAHDFNNQLGIIIGYLDFLKQHISEEDEASQWVQISIRATLRCMDLTRQLLAFSRRQTKEKIILNLNTTFNELETMISRSVTPEVEVLYFLADDLWLTETDPGEFQDSILNLVINARDAMPDGGKLLIETTNKYLDADYAEFNPGVEAGDYVQLMLSDTGVGMDKEIMEHIFEPFFTTKPEGKGTGLGMAMVYGFAKRYNGYIKVYSEPGVGTSIRLYLPRSSAGEAAVNDNDSQKTQLPTGSESILIVDDEVDLLQIADRYLSELGYTTFQAENAAQSLEILEKEERIDLIFSDVVMPGGMNGYELAQQATLKRPNLKVLLTSGFTLKTIAHNGLARFSSNILSKPYRKADLAQRVRMVLDEESVP